MRSTLPLTLSLLALSPPTSAQDEPAGRAFLAAKILTCAEEGPEVIDHGVLLVALGQIEAVGRADELAVPDDYELVDLEDSWILPGMIDLHCHVGGGLEYNEGIYLVNPGLRASAIVVPDNAWLARGLAGGVTSVLHIPGSGTNMGGQGVLMKTGSPRYEDNLIRAVGSLKLAQAGNPERFAFGPGRAFQNWNTRRTFERGAAYARAWEEAEATGGEPPALDPALEVFRHLAAGTAQVSAHTQMYQVSLMTVSMVARELGLPVFIDHGTFDSHRMAADAEQAGVPAILGPRMIDGNERWYIDWSGSNPERIEGIAAAYQAAGHTEIGFNTDCIPHPLFAGPHQEELALQAAMAVRYGFDDSTMDAVRGLTIVPARAAGIDDRVGSLEEEKDADFLIMDGHPADPRNPVLQVWIEGELVYDAEATEGRPY